jgi:hypothetical protein
MIDNGHYLFLPCSKSPRKSKFWNAKHQKILRFSHIVLLNGINDIHRTACNQYCRRFEVMLDRITARIPQSCHSMYSRFQIRLWSMQTNSLRSGWEPTLCRAGRPAGSPLERYINGPSVIGFRTLCTSNNRWRKESGTIDPRPLVLWNSKLLKARLSAREYAVALY